MFAKDSIERLEIDLTAVCNAKCPLCARNYKHMNFVPKSRSLSEITSQLDEYENLKYIHLVGALSEPTLYRHFFDLCRYLVGRQVAIEICTNGDTHDESWWSELGGILTHRDSVYFSVCGSTQELHETYRVNCSLQNLLDNARAFRESNKYGIDYIQHIKFEYNTKDLDSLEMKKIMSEFSNINLTETYYTRDKSIYKNPYNVDKLAPEKKMEQKYKLIKDFADRNWELKKEKKLTTDCRAVFEKSVHIDHKGDIFPCYIWMEESQLEEWDQDFNKIKKLSYECCRFCEKNTKKMFDMMECEFL